MQEFHPLRLLSLRGILQIIRGDYFALPIAMGAIQLQVSQAIT